MRVDAHHHLWKYDPIEYDWIDSSMAVLQRDFLVGDLEREAVAAGIDATVAVQARQTMEETYWLLNVAANSKLIRGVVGWAPIASPGFAGDLDRLKRHALLKGLRHVVQGEPDGFLDSKAFNDGIAMLERADLVYDILIFARQLPEAVRFVDRHPRQPFVLDHIAKPAIIGGEFDSWSAAIAELARRENVTCKISGMVTEADWATWTPDGLKRYFDRVLELFGPARLMVGTDWPVLTVAETYRGWWKVVERWLEPLAVGERRLMEGEVAARVYKLDLDSKANQETT